MTISPNLARTSETRIFDIARTVRRCAERIWPRQKGLKFRCMAVSYAFCCALEGHGIRAVVVQGRYLRPTLKRRTIAAGQPHVWVLCEGLIWDLTLTQFEPEADPVAISTRDDPRYEEWTDISLAGIRRHQRELGCEAQLSRLQVMVEVELREEALRVA